MIRERMTRQVGWTDKGKRAGLAVAVFVLVAISATLWYISDVEVKEGTRHVYRGASRKLHVYKALERYSRVPFFSKCTVYQDICGTEIKAELFASDVNSVDNYWHVSLSGTLMYRLPDDEDILIEWHKKKGANADRIESAFQERVLIALRGSIRLRFPQGLPVDGVISKDKLVSIGVSIQDQFYYGAYLLWQEEGEDGENREVVRKRSNGEPIRNDDVFFNLEKFYGIRVIGFENLSIVTRKGEW